MKSTLIELAQQIDRLDPLVDWERRIGLGENLKVLLGDHFSEFERRYESLTTSPAVTVLRQMGLVPAAPPAEAAPAEAPQPPPLTDDQRIDQAAAAYRRWRTLALQPQVAATDLADASTAWTTERDLFEQNTPAWNRLQAATEQIDAEIAEARRRPALYPDQLPGAIQTS